jgi:CRISPR-associated protein Cmr1
MGNRKTPPEPSVLAEAEAALAAAGDSSLWQRYRCKLVTPMYGGGVEKGKVDDRMPIRATSIRGQLRFWWRLLNRNAYLSADGKPDHKALFEAERELWGGLGDAGTLTASKVKVLVENPGKFSLKNSAEQREPADKYAFGAAANNGEANWVSEGLTWTLAIETPPEFLADVERTLRWWASFGGLGARTRRGFGAVEVKDSINEAVLPSITVQEAASSGCQLKLSAKAANAIAAWRFANEKMRVFRQEPGVGRKTKREGNTAGSSPGRSHWPEPDAIRRATNCWFGQFGKKCHQNKSRATGKWEDVGLAHDHAPVHPAGQVFPRAAFGLPIIFKFKDDKDGDPAASTLVPVGKERMASPVILRPYREQSGWKPMALVLPLDHVWSMKTELKQGNICVLDDMDWWPSSSMQEDKANKIPPMSQQGNDPIAAFINFFEQSSIANSSNAHKSPQAASADIQLDGAQIKYNSKNGSLTVKKENTEALALADAAKTFLDLLSLPTRQKIQRGEFVRVNATINGREIKSIEERK